MPSCAYGNVLSIRANLRATQLLTRDSTTRGGWLNLMEFLIIPVATASLVGAFWPMGGNIYSYTLLYFVFACIIS